MCRQTRSFQIKKEKQGTMVLQYVRKDKGGRVSIYVGNLSNETTEDDLKTAFAAFGEVTGVNIIKDKFTGQPRGFAFVEMAAGEITKTAIAGMNGKELKGKTLTVNEAKPKSESGKKSFGGGGGGGYRGGGRGFGGNREDRDDGVSGRRSFGPEGSKPRANKNRGGGGGHRG